MADKNDLNEPKVDSNYLDVLDSLRGHISRLWKGDYAGMTNLVTGMRRWVTLSNSNIKLVSRNADGSESTLFDSSSKADVLALAEKANTSDVNTALAAKANTSDVNTALATKANTSYVNTALAEKASLQQVESMKLFDKNTQGWLNVKDQRSKGIFYTNTTSKIMIVNIGMFFYGGISGFSAEFGHSVAGYYFPETYSVVGNVGGPASFWKNVTIIVPPGKNYSFDFLPLPSPSQSYIYTWYEYRE